MNNAGVNAAHGGVVNAGPVNNPPQTGDVLWAIPTQPMVGVPGLYPVTRRGFHCVRRGRFIGIFADP